MTQIESQNAEQSDRTDDRDYKKLKVTVWMGMLAFIVLAGYGFYLIFTLTQSVASLDKSVGEMATQMTKMTRAVDHNLNSMNQSFTQVSATMSAMQTNTEQLAQNMAEMTRTIQLMNQSMQSLRQNVGQMNRSVGRPLSFFSQFMPETRSPPPPYYYPVMPQNGPR